VYVVGPLVGAAVAVACSWILRGRGGDPISHAAGSGMLTPGRRAAARKLASEIDAERSAPAADPSTGAGDDANSS
jgi:hypothetical protein